MQAASVSLSGYSNAANKADLRHYFQYSHQEPEAVQDELRVVQFGEYLVDQGLIDRYQLFRVLQMQDWMPGVRLGEAAAVLGFASKAAIAQMLLQLQALATIDVD